MDGEPTRYPQLAPWYWFGCQEPKGLVVLLFDACILMAVYVNLLSFFI